jgi:RNA polymerase sigma-70 factor (ECF subfamily)
VLPVRSVQGPLDERIARFQAELIGFLRRRVGADAEELAQETWLRVAGARVEIPDDAAFRAFAFTIARRLLIDRHRRAATRPVLVSLEDEPAAADDPAAAVQARETMAVVDAELAAMKAELAEVFRLRTSTDTSFAEIARRQGVGLNTALGRMHQATRRIATALAQAGLLPGGDP